MRTRPFLLITLAVALLLVGCDSGSSSPASQPQPIKPAVGTATVQTDSNLPLIQATQVAATPAPPEVAASDQPSSVDSSVASDVALRPTTLRPVVIQVPARWSSFKPGGNINLPAGFKISVFAAGLNKPRLMAYAPNGDLFVTNLGGQVAVLPDRNADGIADEVKIYASNLNQPHGIAFHKGYLYIAEEGRVIRYRYGEGDLKATADPETIISGVPTGAGHSTRTIAFGPDDRLYLSVGSSCNVCEETDAQRAAITVYDENGGNKQLYAKGLRNAVGLTFAPGSNNLWTVVNGRDGIGDNVPPEILAQPQAGEDFGWPYCYGDRQFDRDFGRKDASYCQQVALPDLKMQAHSAPLGLDFYTASKFPTAYRGGLFIGFHGSWNRSQPTGYKLVYVPFKDGTPQPTMDFATGWLGGKWGRPVAPLTASDGSLLLTDDRAGVVYRITYGQ